MDKSGACLEAGALFAQGRIAVLDHPPLLRELRLLERRPALAGRRSSIIRAGRLDDQANALCLGSVLARERAAQAGHPLVW